MYEMEIAHLKHSSGQKTIFCFYVNYYYTNSIYDNNMQNSLLEKHQREFILLYVITSCVSTTYNLRKSAIFHTCNRFISERRRYY